MPHDEDSTEIEWVGYARGEEYETEYGCCGKTVEGEGDLGPPDGWCYEGMHTVSQVKSSPLPISLATSQCGNYNSHMLISTLSLDGRKTCTVP
jgi:hypothetical protein